jgi:dissimilatory sulfite reductase (desulfoviridin) alpha/beta subunit
VTNLHELKNGLLFLLAESAAGIYNGEQLRKICEVAQDDSVILKVTEDQRLGFMLEPSRVDSVRALLEPCGVTLRLYGAPSAPAPKSCLGELCPFSVQDALGDSIELGALLGDRFRDAETYVKIGMNGCEKACASTATDDIHIVGEESGYKISIGGKCAEIPQLGQFLIDNVSKETLPDIVCRVLETYYAKREEGEILFDVVEREGMGIFTAAAEGLKAEEAQANDVGSLGENPSADVEDMLLDDAAEELDAGEAVTPAESKALLGEEEFDVSMDAELDDVSLDAMNVPVDEEKELDADLNSSVREKLDAVEEMNIDDDIDVATSPEGDAEVGHEVDVDSELASVAQVQAIASEMSDESANTDTLELIEDLDVEVANNVVEVDEHIVVGEALLDDDVSVDLASDGSESQAGMVEETMSETEESVAETSDTFGDHLTLEEPGLNFEEAGAEDVGRMTAALHSEASAATHHSLGSSSGTVLRSVMPEAIAVHSDEAILDASEQAHSTMDVMEEEELSASTVIDDSEAEELKNAEAGVSEPVLREDTEEATPVPRAAAKKSLPAVSKSKGRLRLKLGEQGVKIVLPNGIECAVPLAWVEENGVFEMDVGESTLSVEKQGDFLVFRYGDLVMNVPSMMTTTAA